MKVVILAGGFGTRISEHTDQLPKPMIKIGPKPIIAHIMDIYIKHGYHDFIIAAGYKGSILKKYFKNQKKKINVKVIDTGLNSQTGGRIRRLKKYIGSSKFFLTYGDGLANINIKKLLALHNKNKSQVTVSTVRPPARFGFLRLSADKVISFKEKSQLDVGWINGGFFVMEPSFIDYIKSDQTYLEREPLEQIAKEKKISAYKHYGFWQCMDTKRDKKILDQLVRRKKKPWLV